MSEERKLPRWLPWTIAIAVVFVAYPLSMGPITWLGLRGYWPEWFDDDILDALYRPLLWSVGHAPERFSDLFFWYSDLWIPENYP